MDIGSERTFDFTDTTLFSGYSLDFSSSTIASISKSRPLEQPQSWTVEAWIKLDQICSRDFMCNPVLVKFSGSPSRVNYYLSITETGKLRAGFISAANGAHIKVIGSSTLPVAEWMHVAATHDIEMGQLKVFVNGGLDGRTYDETRTIALVAVDDFHLGRWGSDVINGKIANVRIWNIARSTEIIAKTFGVPSRLLIDKTGLSAGFDFAEGTGHVTVGFPDASIQVAFTGGQWSTDIPDLHRELWNVLHPS